MSGSMPLWWQLSAAAVAAVAILLTAFFLFRRNLFGKILGGVAIAACVVTALPYLASSPFAALIGFVAAVSAGFFLKDFRVRADEEQHTTHTYRCLQRVRWASLTTPLLVGLALFVCPAGHVLIDWAIATAIVINLILFCHWLWNQQSRTRLVLLSMVNLLALGGIVIALEALEADYIHELATLLSILIFVFLPKSTHVLKNSKHWWEPLLDHPARVLFSTFLGLCILGTLLLQIPAATRINTISLVDAAFTSVSAVCVTGLIVLDTPKDFSLFGQILILLFIQLGGLGIMTISTVALHAIGRRLSLRHERVLTSMADAERHDLVASLITILRFTFTVEAVGALTLFVLFLRLGEPLWPAFWQGVFTSVSAFCNAGFALQSDSLISYQKNALILHTITTLIVLGGIAPATSLIIPKWLRKRPIPLSANIALTTTAFLLFSGTLFFLALEWNGALAGFSLADKINNAWFQSVTLRTAGFNSIRIDNVANPTFLIMLCFMFIGGSPGGTAGGVKTSTVGILALTFWANVRGRSQVIAQNRRIPQRIINRAVTIIGSGVLVWFVLLLMLEITQQIPARDIIFELTSALGTVGLSTGATAYLDDIGKIIIIIAMFVGRVGPITMFMLLNEDYSGTQSRCPDAQINLS
jgi:trk system potassium uptake protein TrkH